MSEDSYNSDPEPTHPDMSMNFESNQDKSQRSRKDSQNNQVQQRKDQEYKAEMHEITLHSKANEQEDIDQDDYFVEGEGEEEEEDIQNQQLQFDPNQLQIDQEQPSQYRKRKFDPISAMRNSLNEQDKKLKSEESKERNKQHSLKLEFIQIGNEGQQVNDGLNMFESVAKKKLVGRSTSCHKNGNSQTSMNSPKSAATNAQLQLHPPSYYFKDQNKDLIKDKDNLHQLKIQLQSKSQQQQQQIQLKQQSNQNEEVKNKFRISNCSDRANSQLRERMQSQQNNNLTFQSQNVEEIDQQQDNYDDQEDAENQVDYSVLSNYVNKNNYFSEHDHLNKLYDKDTSPQKKQQGIYTTKLAKQFDIKNNPYAVRPYSVDKSGQKRKQNNSMNSKIGESSLHQSQNMNESDKQKKSSDIQNPSVIIINQIQSSDMNDIQKTTSQTVNQVYKHTVTQLQNLNAVTPNLNQDQSPIEKYVNLIKNQYNNNTNPNNNINNSNNNNSNYINRNNNNIENKGSSYAQNQNGNSFLSRHSVGQTQNVSYVSHNEVGKQFHNGKRSVPDVLSNNNSQSVSKKQPQMQMQRRVSQPHQSNQRSITQDKYDDIIKSVLYPEKKTTPAKAPEFRTNAIAELKKQLNQLSGELEFEKIKNAELFHKFQTFRQKLLGKVDKSIKLAAKNEFEAEILHVEQKVKTLKKKLKTKDEEINSLKLDVQNAKVDVDNSKIEIERVRQTLIPENEKLKFEIAEHKNNIENLNIKIDTKEKSISELHKALKNSSQDIEKLFGETASQKLRIDEKQSNIDRLEQQVQTANQKLQDLSKIKQELESYKQNQQQMIQQKIESERKKKEYEHKLDEFKKLKEENISLKLEMEHQYSQLKGQNEQREIAYKELQVRVQNMNKEREQLIKEKEEETQRAREEQQKRENMRIEIEKYKHEVTALIKETQQDASHILNQSLKADNATITKENIGIKSEVISLQKKNSLYEHDNQNIRKQLQEYRLQIDDLNSKIKEYQSSTMRSQDIDKLKNDCILLQREKESQQIFYEQQIKELKISLNNEIRQTQMYSFKLDNLTKETKIFNPITVPIITNRRGGGGASQDQENIINSGNSSPVQSRTKKQIEKRYTNTNQKQQQKQQQPIFQNNQHFDQPNLSQKYSTKNSVYLDKKSSEYD